MYTFVIWDFLLLLFGFDSVCVRVCVCVLSVCAILIEKTAAIVKSMCVHDCFFFFSLSSSVIARSDRK